MKVRAACACVALLSSGSVVPCVAYELATHANMTAAAHNASVLGANGPVVEKRLGLDIWVRSSTPFRTGIGDFYFDVHPSDGRVLARRSQSYEARWMPGGPLNTDQLRIIGWLMRGAIREDDGGTVAGGWKFEPLDDPFGNFNRYCNHFYDPVNVRGSLGRAFTGYCFGETPLDAVQWALGSLDPFQSEPVELTTRRNHYSVLDAREAMWRALTLKDRAGNPVPRFGYSGEEVRKIYWATTFRTLGDFVHMVQDVGQPQHTRNEGHAGSAGVYERYLEARALRDGSYKIDGITLQLTFGQLPDLTYTSYAAPRFNRYSDFFATSRTVDNIVTGRGLADYSNRGFFTIDSNFGTNNYALPSSAPGAYQIMPAPPNALPYPDMTFSYYYGEVRDRVTDQVDTIAMTTEGLFDEFLLGANPALFPMYTLNRKNYDDRANLLIPRAVGYSVGLLDYFFRGQMQVSLPGEGVYSVVDHMIASGNDPQTGGFRKIKLKVQNTTPDPTGQPNVVEPMDPGLGMLVAVAKFHRNNCYAADLSGEYGSSPRPGGQTAEQCRGAEEESVASAPTPVPQGINAGPSQVEFTFSTPIPISATDLYLQVVYRGPLGNEPDAVVVETVDISEPTYVYNYSRWDQYMYAAYPSTSTGPYTFAQWCTQGGYASIEECNSAHGLTLKFAFSSDGNWIPGYDPEDPTFIPQATWTDIAQERAFPRLAEMVGPVGKFNRVAVLLDAIPSNKGLVVHEWIDPLNPPSIFKWSTGTPVPTINQWDYTTGGAGTLTRSVSYLAGRGVFVAASEADLLNGGTAANLPPLILAPSEIAPGW